MPFPAHHLICPSCQCAAGLFACDDGQITGTFPRVFCPHEGRFAIVTKRGAGDAVDAAGARDEGACRGRRSRGVLIPRRWYQALKKLTLLRGDGGNKARLSGETTKETVKTIARGMPDVSGVTVVTCLRAFYFARKAAGATGARHSLRPLISGRKVDAQLGRICAARMLGRAASSSFRGALWREPGIHFSRCHSGVMDSGSAPLGASRNDNEFAV
jgi:hypothetical protein